VRDRHVERCGRYITDIASMRQGIAGIIGDSLYHAFLSCIGDGEGDMIGFRELSKNIAITGFYELYPYN
jgi:hypothetical protein